MEANHKHLYRALLSLPTRQIDRRRTFFQQEIDTADRFLDLQAFLHLACFNVPKTNGFVVRSTN
jgi:hypothetical protein